MSCEKDFNIFEFLICSFKFRVTVWRLSSLGRYHHPFCLESRKTTIRPWDNLYFHFCIYILNIRDSQLDTRLCYCYCIFAIFIPFFLKCTSFHFYPTNNHDRNDFCYWHFFLEWCIFIFSLQPSPFTIIVIIDIPPLCLFILVSKLK